MHTPSMAALDARRMTRLVRICSAFLKNRLLGRRIPIIASFKLTYRCNLTCSACPFHRTPFAHDRHMDWETACSAMDRLASLGCPIVVFEGGEPLLWSSGSRTFTDIAARAGRLFACVGVTTNGTMPIDVPTDIVWVSIDGTKATHDALRCGSYDSAVSHIRSSSHRRILAHMTINSRNFDQLPAVARQLMGIPAVKGMTVQFFYPYKRGEDDLALARDQRLHAIEDALRLKAQGYPILNSASSLRAMKDNTWMCRPFLLANVETDGTIETGCYLSARSAIDCAVCGFTPVAEASMAHDMCLDAIVSGVRIFI